MKKYFLGLVLITTLVVVPAISSGATAEEIQAIIVQLQSQIATLQAQIVALQGQGTVTPITAPTTSGQPEVKTVVSSLTLTGLLNGQTSIRSSFNVKVTAGGGTIYLLKDATFSSFLKNTTIANDDPHKNQIPTTCTRTETALTNLQTVSTNNSEFYVLPAGQSAYFTATLSCPINQMFSGSYYGQLTQLNYANTNPKDWPTNAWNTTSSTLDLRTSRSVVVVGEKGPWISNVSVTSMDSEGRTVIVKGERLLQVTKAFFDGKQYEIQGKTNSSLSFFVGNLIVDGYHQVSLESVVGKSNTVTLQVGNSTTNTPAVVLSVNGTVSTGYQQPVVNVENAQSVSFTWNSTNADRCNTYGQSKLKLTDGTVWDNSNLPISGSKTFNTVGQVDGLGNVMRDVVIGVQCWNKNVTESKGIGIVWSNSSNPPVVPAICPAGTKIGDLNADGNIDAKDTQLLINNQATSDFITRFPCADVKGLGSPRADAATIQTIINCQLSRACGTFPIVTTPSVTSGIVVAQLSPNSPTARSIVVSSTTVTPNIILGIFRLGAQKSSVKIYSLKFMVRGSGTNMNPTTMYQNARLVDSSGRQFAGGTIASDGTVTFSNLNLDIVKDQTLDLSVMVDVKAGVSFGSVGQVTLNASSDTIKGADANYNNIQVTPSNIVAGQITFSNPGVVVPPPVIPPTTATNLLKNADFSAGQTNWSFMRVVPTVLRNFDGAYNTSNSGEIIYQTVPVALGKTYEYGAKVKSNLASGVCQVDVYGGGVDTDVINSYGVQDKGWSDTFVARGSSVQVRIINTAIVPATGGSVACSYDDLYLKEKTPVAQTVTINQLASALASLKALIQALR